MLIKRKKFLLAVLLVAVLTVVGTSGDLFAMSSGPVEEAEEVSYSEIGEVPEGHIRIHFQNEANNYEDLGLWVWQDVATWSEDVDAWPDGATPFSEEITEYGAYVDVELAEDAQTIGFLVNDSSGDNLSGDLEADILAPEMDQLWIQEEDGEYEVSLYPPVELPENTVRVHYKHEDDTYESWGLWSWGDVVEPSDEKGDWPTGATDFSDDQIGAFGAYVDIELEENATQINFLAVNMETSEQTEDMNVSNLDSQQLFFRADDEGVYTNPYYVSQTGLEAGELLSETIELRFTTTEELELEELEEELTIVDNDGNEVEFTSLEIKDEQKVSIKGEFSVEQAPYQVTLGEREVTARAGWRLIDELYAYDGDLGLELTEDGAARLKLWSPGADDVSVVLYDKDDQYEVVAEDIAMQLGDSGVWEVKLDEANTGVSDLRGYYYHYQIERDGETKLALDPYASSMAAWNNQPDDPAKEYPVGKAAIVDPAEIGPELDFADIEGFETREDAIIYETHVRDFTSDPGIDEDLEAQFGTFAAFAERLDYIEDLGVTHIQLLPIMSYMWGDELANDERLLDYSSSGNNYNWGYDPHSYFSITGMYSEDPNDAELRIKEFKNLIDEIHSRGMGVTLDVVYNHTASVHIFEDLVPNYYHFMDADGTSRTSFGGGRLGTTHEMSRRILVDSILYWVEEFKVDGFRFDMMGDHDAESIQIAYDKAKEINPNIVMIGEGWRTFVGDEDGGDIMPADQDWMQHTESVGVFSDDFRDEMNSGFGAEGEPRFLGGLARDIDHIFDNVRAQPHNFKATHPGDVVPYIEAHDNLTLHDALAIATENDPDENQEELQKRIRLGNTMVLTSQGTAFIHSGQEYGRTKQFRAETDRAPANSYKGVDENGEPFNYPYFIDDSYDSTDAINKFEWSKATEKDVHTKTVDFTRGLIELRRSSDAFRLKDMDTVESNVTMVETDDIADTDLAIAFRTESTDGTAYYVIVNADDQQREFNIDVDLTVGEVLVDAAKAGIEEISNPSGVEITNDSVTLDALTATVIKID